MKTYFITDAHLGSGNDSRKREDDLVRWLDSIPSTFHPRPPGL